MNSIVAALEKVATDLADVLDSEVRGDALPTTGDVALGEILRAAGEVQRRLDAVIIESVSEVEARSVGLRDERFTTRQGCRNTNELLQRVLGVDARDGARLVKASRVVRRNVDISWSK